MSLLKRGKEAAEGDASPVRLPRGTVAVAGRNMGQFDPGNQSFGAKSDMLVTEKRDGPD